jgi:dTDP-4-dehydrorhamnose reductase
MESPYKPEVWGGIECTINRVNDTFFNQLERAGLVARKDMIAYVAALNVKALRYPILWETHEPVQGMSADFASVEDDLEEMRSIGIVPIAGLLHHGSGPAFTNLLDPEFPALFSAYAARVAERFPTLDRYTPINEPLTTSRFSGLYGLWYPHRQSDHDFVRMLINQIKGIVMAMQAIRKINKNAQLIQTEDLCKVHCTPELQYQADFENNRRWLSYDLLFGKVDDEHPLREYLLEAGANDADLSFIKENAIAPGIIGVNYYATSERFLDHNVDRYDKRCIGGNGKESYADVEACRTGHAHGISALIHETWDRYKAPIAITEAHLACSREDQLRWFSELWNSACDLNAEGVDIRAVTAWSLFGAYDWDSLVTQNNGHYEPGAYDISSGSVRQTALGKMIKGIATNGRYKSPLLQSPGWWKTVSPPKSVNNGPASSKPVLILGNGPMSKALAKLCASRHILYVVPQVTIGELADRNKILNLITTYRPWAIINTVSYHSIGKGENNLHECLLHNTLIPEAIAFACKECGIQFMTFSSAQVFNGEKNAPYDETDDVFPINHYGLTQAMAEAIVGSIYDHSLIIRTSALFGNNGYDDCNNVALSEFSLPSVGSAGDAVVTPTYIPHVAGTALDLLIDEEHDVWHLSNSGNDLKWSEFTAALHANQRGGNLIHPSNGITSSNGKWKQPKYCALTSVKGCPLPTLDRALAEYHSNNQRR